MFSWAWLSSCFCSGVNLKFTCMFRKLLSLNLNSGSTQSILWIIMNTFDCGEYRRQSSRCLLKSSMSAFHESEVKSITPMKAARSP